MKIKIVKVVTFDGEDYPLSETLANKFLSLDPHSRQAQQILNSATDQKFNRVYRKLHSKYGTRYHERTFRRILDWARS